MSGGRGRVCGGGDCACGECCVRVSLSGRRPCGAAGAASGIGEWEVGGAGGEESCGCEGHRDRSCSHVVRDVACTEVYACTGPSLVVAWLVSALHCTVVKSKTGSLQKFTGIEPADASRSQCSTLKHRLHAELWELCTRVCRAPPTLAMSVRAFDSGAPISRERVRVTPAAGSEGPWPDELLYS